MLTLLTTLRDVSDTHNKRRYVMVGLFEQSASSADICWLIAVVMLWFVGVISIINNRPAKYGWLQGVSWIATGFIAAGLLFITS